MWDVPGFPVRVIVRAVFDGAQWDAPSSFRRRLDMIDVIVMDWRPLIGATVSGLRADEFDADSYEARTKAADLEFGGAAFLVIGERAELDT